MVTRVVFAAPKSSSVPVRGIVDRIVIAAAAMVLIALGRAPG
jgi:hypothetical protein